MTVLTFAGIGILEVGAWFIGLPWTTWLFLDQILSCVVESGN